MGDERSPAFYWLAAFFGLFVLFLYGPMIVIFILSFQGPTGGRLSMSGVSLHRRAAVEWRRHRQYPRRVTRSLELGFVIMILTVLLSLSAGWPSASGPRREVFFVAVASLIVPSIVTSLGIALEFGCLTIFSESWTSGSPIT
jgi:putative spermidine/putrescine transport system permease protein